MSVVNQMLRDIQDRQGPATQLPLQRLDSESSNLKFISFVILILAIVSSLLFFAFKNQWFSNVIANVDATVAPDNIKKENLNQANVLRNSIGSKAEVLGLKSNTLSPESIRNKPKNSNIVTSQAIPTKTIPAKTILTPAKTRKDTKPERLIDSASNALSEVETTTNPFQSVTTESNVKAKIDSAQPEKDNKDEASMRGLVTSKTQNATRKSDQVLQGNNNNSNSISSQSINRSSRTLGLKELESIRSNQAILGNSKSIESLTDLIRRQPELHSARLLMIQLMWQSNHEDVTAAIEQAINLFPDQSAFRLIAARFYIEKGNFVQAFTKIGSIDTRQSDAAALLQTRAFIHQKQNNHAAAINDYAAILQHQPNRGDIYIALGISLESINRLEQAKMSFEKAMLDKRLSKKQVDFLIKKIQRF